MGIQTYKFTNLDAYESFISLKQRFPEAFFFEVNDRLSVIGLEAYEVIYGDSEILNILSKILSDNYETGSIPFENGGAFGCIGHEVVSAIEPTLKNSGYFKYASIEAEIMLAKELVIFEHEKGLVHFNTTLDVNISDLKSSVKNIMTNGPVEFDYMTAHSGKETFLKSVTKIKEHIKQGDIFQAVLSERFERKISSTPLSLYKNVRNLGPSAYSFYFDFKSSSFFGSSPESFLTIHGDCMTTHPIAGTKPRGMDSQSDALLEEELKNCSKEAAEHLMLVDLARNDLGRVATTNSVEVVKFRTLLKLPNVMHLVSEVIGKKRISCSAVDAFKACFPAGTLSGAPKVRALEILSEIETRPRGFYGGAVVAFDFGGNLESCIAIRSIEVKDSTAILRAGAGIVADSIAEKEYEEIHHKLKGMMTAIGAMEASL